ncbi:hypothetical protein QOZ80_7BG0593110 [Eleusine coracana subsp. coracana]|nr:hypothetical protein QOZ80_7BG0593110 [Eleusine coracana subsp. coracana]
MDDFLIGSFMEFTGCTAPEDAAHHLASCGWNLDEAVNLFFSIGAGTSGSSVADAEDGVRALIPARSDTLYGRADDDDVARRPAASSGGGLSRGGSRWDSQTRVGNNNSSRRRNRNSRQRRRDRLREDDEDRRQRRRVDDGDGGMEVDADHTSRLRLYDRFLNNSGNNHNNNNDKKKEDDLEEMFRPPDELTFKGGFYEAKSYAAWRARWLLVNVHDTGEFAFASFTQNRDVWKRELVAQHVRDHFVLWRVDADANSEEAEEARKVCCYYKLPLDKIPAVVVVDPVTGQAMATLQGASTDPNDFLVAMRPYVTSKPVVPAARATMEPATSSSSSSVAGEPVKQEGPVKMTTTPTSSQRTERRQEQQAPPIEKQTKPLASAVAVAPTTVQPAPMPTPAPPAPAPPAPAPAPLVGMVCKLRVRLPGGRVVTKEFGSASAVSALFAYCCSELIQGEAGNKNRPFRLMRLVGSTREEIADPSVSFEDSGLYLSTVSVLLIG